MNEKQLATIHPELDGWGMTLDLHPGQTQAWKSNKRFVLVMAGTQGGKTSFGPYWLYREIITCGPGDYLIVTPTFQLLERKLLGEFRRVFEKVLDVGRYRASPMRVFEFSDDGERRTHRDRYDPNVRTRVQFGYAEDSDSLESMTALACWCDEAGQKKFRLDSWQAILRRLSLTKGRVLVTTSVYSLHWLKGLIEKANAGDKSIEVVRFDSTENPTFPAEEFERARRDLPAWKFNMLYRGMFDRPAGLIYDCIDESVQRVPRFTIPPEWKRCLGLDFGTVNTAGVYVAEEPETKRLYIHQTYHHGGESAQGHVRRLLQNQYGIPYAVGGSWSEDDWRTEFRKAGLPVRKPKIRDVEVGITRTYGAWQRGELYAFDDLDEFWDEVNTYSRALDENGEPTDKIEDAHAFHLMDAQRYILSDLRGGAADYAPIVIPAADPLAEMDRAGF